jgi:hypothetical protein
MPRLLRLLFALPINFFRSRRNLLLENLAIRQQLSVLSLKHPQPRFAASDKWFWVMLRHLLPEWKQYWFLSNQRLLCAGIAQGSSSIGRGSRGIVPVLEENV